MLIVFDLETTGLPKAEGSDLDMQPKIIEFGAIKLTEELIEVDRLEFFCNPKHLLDPKITKITGITDDMLKDEKPFIAHLDRLNEFFLGTKRMFAHNLGFDRKILKFELERLDKVTSFPWPYEHTCTVEVGQRVWGKMRKLGDIYEELFEEKIEGAHRSINDVEATLRIIEWYAKEGHI
jgi:DNA polymerase-3 subunit epsilon|tara:strand:+ start:1149 stop:1685 length:537 start_codon:yes stop_codon:yes gene_type:complete